MENLDRNLALVPIEDEMKRSYMDYAMSVIVSRAIPDARDGLKPVHRRILYAMKESGYYYDKPHRKSARIVGDVIGKYHPHGDVAVYDSLVRMAQDFSLRAPLVDGQGNFGSIDGDSPAAMRYTESRLTEIAQTLLNDIDKDTVGFNPNYDGSESEPSVLPAGFPNLLVNGGGGIAVGMATNIPPHNLGEIIDACLLYADDSDIDIEELLSVVKGPDFPTGGIIMGKGGIRSAYLTGRGSVVIRGKVDIEDNGSKQSIIISEIPYAVNKAKLVEKIAELVKEKRIEGISDLRDESNKEGVRVAIELKKGTLAEFVVNQLYSYTPLQTSFGVNMLALDGNLPKTLNLKEAIGCFVNFREEVITKRTIFLLNKARDRSHALIGLRIAVDNIDEVVAMIKASKDPVEARASLTAKLWKVEKILDLIKLVDDRAQIEEGGFCRLTESQAQSILDMRLQRLTAMEKGKLEDEINRLAAEIEGHIEILSSRPRLIEILKEELSSVKEKFATPRLSVIEENFEERDEDDLIQREDMVVTFTLGGYIKRVPLASYRSQNRGGKGRTGLSVKDEDVAVKVFVGSTHTPTLFFSNLGQVYSLKLYKLPLGAPQGKGRPIVNLLPLKEGERITNLMPLPEDEKEWDDLNIMFATSKGNIRRNDLSDFKRIQSNGKIAIRLDEGDSLVNVKVCKDGDHVLLATRLGKAIRFPVDSVRVFKSRTSDGVRGMKLARESDGVISMTILKGVASTIEERESYLSIPTEKRLEIASGADFSPEGFGLSVSKEKIREMASSEEFLLSVSEHGFGKRTSTYEYRVTDRGGSGIINMDVSEKTGPLVASIPAGMKDELILVTDKGKLIRCKLESVRITGRNTGGVILFKTDSDEKVVSVSLIEEEPESEE